MNVLIVDDQISVIKGILSGVHFKELGIDVVRTATSSEEALAILSEGPVDIMLTDIEMPDVNGLELNKKVQEKYPDTLRILLTSHAEFRYAQEEALSWGCFDYLLQPILTRRSRNACSARCSISIRSEKLSYTSMGSCSKQTRLS